MKHMTNLTSFMKLMVALCSWAADDTFFGQIITVYLKPLNSWVSELSQRTADQKILCISTLFLLLLQSRSACTVVRNFGPNYFSSTGYIAYTCCECIICGECLASLAIFITLWISLLLPMACLFMLHVMCAALVAVCISVAYSFTMSFVDFVIGWIHIFTLLAASSVDFFLYCIMSMISTWCSYERCFEVLVELYRMIVRFDS